MIDFKEHIKNRRVVLVGPSPTMIGGNLGETIDNYEVVIKLNGAITASDAEYTKHYGARNDVLYLSEYTSSIIAQLKIRDENLKFIRANSTRFITREWKEKFPNANIFLANEFKKPPYFKSLPLLGTVALQEILNAKPKQLTVLGFDFYTSSPTKRDKHRKGNVFHNGGVRKLSDLNKELIKDLFKGQGNPGNHIELHDFLFFYDRWLNKKYVADYFLINLFGMYEKFLENKL